MSHTNLTEIELINGILSICFASISIFVGAKIVSKYFEYRKKTFLYVGLTWIGLVSMWYASSISVIMILSTGNGISDELYMFIGNGLLSITAFIWMIPFTELVFKKRQKVILILSGIYFGLFELYFIYYLFTNPSVLGEVIGPVDAFYSPLVTVFHISMIILILVSGTMIGRISLRSTNPEIRLKGKFLIIAAYSFAIGAAFEVISHLSLMILIIGRLILISSAISFYGGWFLPNWMKKPFLKKNRMSER